MNLRSFILSKHFMNSDIWWYLHCGKHYTPIVRHIIIREELTKRCIRTLTHSSHSWMGQPLAHMWGPSPRSYKGSHSPSFPCTSREPGQEAPLPLLMTAPCFCSGWSPGPSLLQTPMSDGSELGLSPRPLSYQHHRAGGTRPPPSSLVQACSHTTVSIK